MTDRGGFIQTFTGRLFYPLDPRPDDICIEDIAHALSNTCRFNGHTRAAYSVADHSLRVSELVPVRHALWGLMHDAAEAYICDVPTPIKGMLRGYKDIESKILAAIAVRFDMPIGIPGCVHDADAIMLATEARDLMPPHHCWASSTNHRPLEGRIVPWDAPTAEHLFLERFAYLTTPRTYKESA